MKITQTIFGRAIRIAGYNVEIDVWFVDGKFKLGHDEPTI
jgi:hypothetical protein